MQARTQVSKQVWQAGNQAGMQAISQELKRHAVRAMPCRGLFSLHKFYFGSKRNEMGRKVFGHKPCPLSTTNWVLLIIFTSLTCIYVKLSGL